MFANLVRIVHCTLMIKIFAVIFTQQICPVWLFASEFALTIVRSVIEKRSSSVRTKLQIILSLLLGYSMFPNKYQELSWLFFWKVIQIHQSLKQLRHTSCFFNNKEPQKYLAFLFDCFRYSLNEFVLFWFVCIVYRYLCDSTHEPIPETHKLIYQLVVTASTIGYGDLTPKTDMQIIFFIFAIPVLCSSFVVYVNSLVEVYTNTFLAEDQHTEHREHGKKQ